MAINPDDYEEIIPEEEKGDEEEGLIDDETPEGADNQVDLSEDPEGLSGDTDKPGQEQPIIQEEEPINTRPNNFQPINDKRVIDKKARSIRFIKTFIRNKNKTMEEVARELNITTESAKKYLSEYVSVVVKSLEMGTYPNMVVQNYNDTSMPKQQRLTVQDVQDMKPIILRYHSINIDALQENLDKPDKKGIYRPQVQNPTINRFVDDVFEDEIGAELPQSGGKFKKYNEFKQSRPVSSPRELTEESSIGDVIEFGIINSGQPDAARIKRIKTMFMSNPPHYLADESRFEDLLEANDIKPKVITTFMDWLKYTAPIRPNERIGFLAAAKAQGPIYQQPGGPYQSGRTQTGGGQPPFKKFDINDYDEYAQFLYTEGVYQYGLPPEHPVNKDSYKRYMDDKRYEEDQKKTMRQLDMMVKQNMLRMGGGMMPGQQQMQGGGQTGIAYDENYLFQQGIVVPEISYNEHGQKITRWIPTGKTPMSSMFSQGGENKDDFTDSISKFSRFLEAVRPMMQSQGQGQAPPQNPIVDRIMEAAVNKLFSKADETPSKVLENQMSLFQQFKQLFPATDNQPLTPEQANLQLQLAKLNTDREFHKEEVEFKKRQLEMEERRHEEAKSESKDGISMIFDALGKGFNIIQPVLTSLLMGQGGGGLSGMLGGALGGGMPPQGPVMANPPGSMTGMGMMDGGMGMQQNPFSMQQEPEMMDNIPAPNNIPQDFMPQPQNLDPYMQPQPQYQPPPPPTYQAAPNPYQPQSPEPPFPQIQPPSDFLPENPPEPFAIPQSNNKPVPNENDFLNSLTPEELSTLSVDELAEVERRISSKQSKLERVLNSIKSTKVRKQFGYRQVPEPDYSTLDVPKNIPADYDGMPDYQPSQPEPVVGGAVDENVPSQVENQHLQEAEQDFEQGATLTAFDITTQLDPSIDFESFNNDIMEIDDMGNDNQQFNQQNDANQKEFIDKMAAIDAAEKLRVENEKRKAAGLAPLLTLETVNGQQQQSSTDALAAPDNALNNDSTNTDPSLNETKTGPSEQFTKDAQKHAKEDKKSHHNKSTHHKTQSHKGSDNDETKKVVGTEDLGSPSHKAENEDITISNTTANTTEKTVKTDLKDKDKK